MGRETREVADFDLNYRRISKATPITNEQTDHCISHPGDPAPHESWLDAIARLADPDKHNQ